MIFVIPSLSWAEEGFPYLWSGFSSSLAGRSPEQRHNAALAGRALNGVIVPPGKILSFNGYVASRDTEKGFIKAPFYNAQGETGDTPGGGICQLASVLYNAALLGGMKVVERHPHSRLVWHVPPGRDATISGWRKDLKMQNPFPHPLQLRVVADQRRLNVSFHAPQEKDFQVELLTEQTTLEAETVVWRDTEKGAKEQTGGQGLATITKRVIKKDGETTEEILSRDVYPAPSRILTESGQ
jgi:vancomycin resistance protein YoaR